MLGDTSTLLSADIGSKAQCAQTMGFRGFNEIMQRYNLAQKVLNVSQKQACIQQIFTSSYYAPSTVLGTRDANLNKIKSYASGTSIPLMEAADTSKIYRMYLGKN